MYDTCYCCGKVGSVSTLRENVSAWFSTTREGGNCQGRTPELYPDRSLAAAQFGGPRAGCVRPVRCGTPWRSVLWDFLIQIDHLCPPCPLRHSLHALPCAALYGMFRYKLSILWCHCFAAGMPFYNSFPLGARPAGRRTWGSPE